MSTKPLFRGETVRGSWQNAASPDCEGMEGVTVVGGRFIARFSIAAVSVYFRQY